MRLSGVAALMAIACLAPCQTTEKFLLRLHPKAGQSTHMQFDLHIETINRPGAMDLSSKVKSEFVKQTAKGYEWKEVVEASSLKATGAYAEITDPEAVKKLEGTSYLLLIDAKGKVLSVDPPGSDRMSSTHLIFPDDPVGIGSKWKVSITTPKGPRQMDFVFSQVLVQDGLKEALIESTPEGNPDVLFSGPAKYWIDLSTGALMKYEASGSDGKGRDAIRAKSTFTQTYDIPQKSHDTELNGKSR